MKIQRMQPTEREISKWASERVRACKRSGAGEKKIERNEQREQDSKQYAFLKCPFRNTYFTLLMLHFSIVLHLRFVTQMKREIGREGEKVRKRERERKETNPKLYPFLNWTIPFAANVLSKSSIRISYWGIIVWCNWIYSAKIKLDARHTVNRYDSKMFSSIMFITFLDPIHFACSVPHAIIIWLAGD